MSLIAEHRTRTIWRLVGAFFALSLLLAACGGGDDAADDDTTGEDTEAATEEEPEDAVDTEEEADDEAAAGGEPEVSELRVGLIPIVDVAPVYIAQSEGIFEEEGLTVEVQDGVGGAAIIPAMIAGELDVSFGNYVSMILAENEGLGLALVAEGNRAVDGFSGVFVLPDSDIQEAADLEGATVAVNTLNNVGTVAISAVLEEQGVDPESIEFIEVPFPEMGATLERGDVDAIWVVEPFTSNVQATLDAREIIDPFSGPTEGLPVAGYAVTADFAEENPNTVAAFRRAIEAASQMASDDPDLVTEALLSYTEIPEEAAGGVTQPEWVASLDPNEVQRVSDLMADYGFLDEPLDVSGFTIAN